MKELEGVLGWLKAHEDESVDFLRRLVRIPSVNPWFYDYDPYTTELEAQRFLRDYLRESGFAAELMFVDEESLKPYEGMPGYYEGRPMRNRPNLHAVRKGAGGGRSILLTGHADVVIEGDGWTRPPFEAGIADGYMYGRGTVDMKGGIAAMVMAARAICESGVRLKGDVVIGVVSDEEAGGMGILDYIHRGVHADGAIMTEPTDGAWIAPMCRGILWGKIVIPARAGHIELFHGDWREGGAVDGVKLMRLYLDQIDRFNEYWATRKRHPLLQMPCQILVAQVRAGEYPSAYAGSAEIVFNAQYLPEDLDEKYRGSRVKAQIEEMVARVAQTDEWLRENPPHVEWMMDSDCAESPVDGEFVQTMLSAARKINPRADLKGLGCHADIGWIVRAGIPTVVFGPGDGRLAHQPDERIEIDNYLQTICALASMILDWCGVEGA